MTIASVGLVEEGYRERAQLVERFFGEHAARIAELCHLMARRFARGGRLIAFGTGSAATDAQHVSVEFVHPVIVGKRALPALALPNDVPTSLGLTFADATTVFARQLDVLGSPEDIVLGMVHGPHDAGRAAASAALEEASQRGMLTIALGGGTGAPSALHSFEVPSEDPFVVQEVHETLYHVLWELVHVFFEHKGLLEDRPAGRTHDTGRSSFLYPFLAEAETDLQGVLEDVEASVRRKAADVVEMRRGSMDPEGLAETARLVSERLADGGKVIAFGNGGSATDAQDLVADLCAPPPGLKAFGAISLTNDAAVLTAVGNDVGYDNVFARQMISWASPEDVAVGISTSGNSRNVVAAMEEAGRQGLLTVGLSGYGGGRLAEVCARAHVIDADYIPRIQEAQATQYHTLRRLL